MHDSPSTRRSTEPPASPGIRRAANLWLRGPGGPVSVRVHWPASTALGSPPPVIVVLAEGTRDGGGASAIGPADDFLSRQLCAALGALVLTAPAGLGVEAPSAALERAAGPLEWAADHAAELDADPARLAVAGRGAGARAAEALAARARALGWPRIAHEILIGEDGDDVALIDAARKALR